jgi:dUTP pyrophosphatase
MEMIRVKDEMNKVIRLNIPSKLLRNGQIPDRVYEDDAASDAYIESFVEWDEDNNEWYEVGSGRSFHIASLGRIGCRLGFAAEIPKGYCFLVMPRSGNAIKKGLTILNTPGLIDPGYRNEWIAVIVNLSTDIQELQVGDKICQLFCVPITYADFIPTQELNDSTRGLNGFGSTG